jgi:hypothetical protein
MVGLSWPIAPETSEIPASPASAPETMKAKNTIFDAEKPAKRPALGLWPSTFTSKPRSVRDSMNQAATAATSAKTKPQWARPEDDQTSGRMAYSWKLRVSGKFMPPGLRQGPRTSQSRKSWAT